MIDLPLIVLGGLLGSSHCVGMCGGFVLAIGLTARGASRNLSRQLVYCAGRIFTYGFLGSVAGFAGFWSTRRSGTLVHAQSLLSLTAGVILIVQGLGSLGFVTRGRFDGSKNRRSAVSCLAGSFTRAILSSARWHHVFVAGMFNGLLPCGLVYGYLALASSTASLPAGMVTMAAFGAGTVPAMVLTGVGTSVLSHTSRRRLFRIAGACVLVTGLLAINRGVASWVAGATSRCPGCQPSNAATPPAIHEILGVPNGPTATPEGGFRHVG